MPSDTLTDVKISKARDRPDAAKAKGSAHVMLPGMKQRMEVPRVPLTGQTMGPARPVRLRNHGIVGDVDPFVVDADAVVAAR